MELPKLPPKQKSETDLMQWMRFLNGKRREDFEKMAKKKTGENRGRKEIILSMIEAGLPLEQIAEITKETLETIQELKKKMG